MLIGVLVWALFAVVGEDDTNSDDPVAAPATTSTSSSAAPTSSTEVDTGPPTFPEVFEMPDLELPNSVTTGPPADYPLRVVSPDPYWVVTEDVDGVEFSGMLVIGAPNIRITNSVINATTDAFGVWNPDLFPGVTVDHVEINCEGDGTRPTSAGIKDVSNISNNEISGCADGIKLTSDTTVTGNYIHNLADGPDIHTDGIQMQGGDNVVISGNTIVGLANAGANSAVFIQSEDASISNVTVSENYLSGFGFTVRLNGDRITESVVVQNVIGPGYRFGPILLSEGAELAGADNTVLGNFSDDGTEIE